MMTEEIRRGDRRVTFSVLRSGQPRPYADSVLEVEVRFEQVPYTRTEWAPWMVTKEQAMDKIENLGCGFTRKTASDSQWHESRLTSFQPSDPNENGLASRWTFRVVSPYTD